MLVDDGRSGNVLLDVASGQPASPGRSEEPQFYHLRRDFGRRVSVLKDRRRHTFVGTAPLHFNIELVDRHPILGAALAH